MKTLGLYLLVSVLLGLIDPGHDRPAEGVAIPHFAGLWRAAHPDRVSPVAPREAQS